MSTAFWPTTPISIHALREEGDAPCRNSARYAPFISIHALREEGDAVGGPRHPVDAISIHALREEGDLWLRPVAR